MSAVEYTAVMLLWWGAVGITMQTRIYMASEYSPGIRLLLMALTIPASFGSWLLPLYELIWGALDWWQIAIGVLLGLVVASWLPRLLLSRSSGLLIGNPLAVLCSVVGAGLLIWSL